MSDTNAHMKTAELVLRSYLDEDGSVCFSYEFTEDDPGMIHALGLIEACKVYMIKHYESFHGEDDTRPE